MTTTAWVLIAAAGVLAVADWRAVARRETTIEYFAKPATLAVLLAVAVVLRPEHADQRGWFVAALAFSLAGDVFLMLREELFVFGLGSFLLAHIAYTIGFALHIDSGLALGVGCVVVVLLGAVLATRIVPSVVHGEDPALAGPVVAYMVVISAMVATALAAGPALAAVGALLFYGSDTLIAFDRFVRPRPWMPVAIIVTYHLGQTGLVLSLAR